MKYLSRVFILFFILFSFGCSSSSSKDYSYSAVEAKSKLSSPINNRLIQKSTSLALDVDSVVDSTTKVYGIVESVNGYVDSMSIYSEESTTIVVKVPSEKLDLVVEQLRKIGKITSERRSSRDVTDEVIDIEARLKNLVDLRARFRELLLKASEIKEVLNIEKELSRIQVEIDSIESRKKMLIGNVEQSRIDIRLKQKRVLGPLGYLGKGLIWAISKLFVIK